MQILSMAWRKVWRNSRRSLVTIAAMTLDLWVMVLYSGLVNGMLRDMARSVTDMEPSELRIVAEGYRDDPSLHRRRVAGPVPGDRQQHRQRPVHHPRHPAPPAAVLDDAKAAVEAAAPGLDVKTWRELLPVVA